MLSLSLCVIKQADARARTHVNNRTDVTDKQGLRTLMRVSIGSSGGGNRTHQRTHQPTTPHSARPVQNGFDTADAASGPHAARVHSTQHDARPLCLSWVCEVRGWTGEKWVVVFGVTAARAG